MTARKLTPVAQKLRRDCSMIERNLWSRLRNRQLGGEKFVRQEIIGNYVADFVCRSARMVIEIDGDEHGSAEGLARDAARTEIIEAYGYHVLRFTNREVAGNIDGVLASILHALDIARNRA
jgi:very-short-patch-repair endonuclease